MDRGREDDLWKKDGKDMNASRRREKEDLERQQRDQRRAQAMPAVDDPRPVYSTQACTLIFAVLGAGRLNQ
jgi:hypothetical protein